MKRALQAFVVLNLLSSLNCWGAGDPEQFVVKLSSYRDHEEIHYEGSGILVRFQKSAYVLTSEHVTLHDSEEATHIELNLDGKAPMKATYISSDWGMGLALLKAPDELASDDLPNLEEMAKTPSPKVDEPAISAGFPVRSASMVVDVDGSVSSTTNSSLILADVEKMLEIKGAHGEFGMSGGAVLNQDLAPIGVLSHETPDPQNKILYAIPISDAARWAIPFITDPNAKPRLVRASSDFRQKYGRVRNGRLIISWLPAFDDKRPSEVSIGGDDTLQNLGLNPPTEAYPAPLLDLATKRICPNLINCHDIGYYPTVTVSRYRPSDILFYKEMKGLSSFVEFFRKAKDPKFKLMAGYNTQGSQPWYWYSYEYCEASRKVRSGTYHYSGDQLTPVLSAIAELTTCYQYPSGPFEYRMAYPLEAIDSHDIESVLNDPQFQTGWNEYRSYNQRAYDELRSALKTIGGVLAQLTP